MATQYDAWRTNVEETNEEAWNDAVEEIAFKLIESGQEPVGDMVHTLAAADSALAWVCGAVEVPHHHLHAFRDLVKMAESYRRQVEAEMKECHDVRD